MPALPYGEKNLVACSRCKVKPYCDYHNIRGEWAHTKGSVPCVVKP
jgi:hypothetical protein